MFGVNTLAVIAALVVATHAQQRSSNRIRPDTCIPDCLKHAASATGCTGSTELHCMCSSMAFEASFVSCLQFNCRPSQLQAAYSLLQVECAILSGSGLR